MKQKDTTVLGLAVCAAFGAALLAIAEHVRWMEAGYGLGAARREHQVLLREAVQAERKLAAARSPSAVVARAKAWNLGLDHYSSQPALPPSSVAAPAVAPAVAPAPVAAQPAKPAAPASTAPTTSSANVAARRPDRPEVRR